MGFLVGPLVVAKQFCDVWRVLGDSFERWTGDASLANCVNIRAAARLGSNLSVGDFGFRVGGDFSIIASKASINSFVEGPSNILFVWGVLSVHQRLIES